MISSGFDWAIKIWSIETGECLNTIKGHSGCVFSILPIAKDRLLSGSWDSTIKLWCLRTYKCLGTLTFKFYNPRCFCLLDKNDLSSNVACGLSDGSIVILDLNTFQLIKTAKIHPDKIMCLKPTNTGLELVSCSKDYSIKIVDVKTLIVLRSMKKHLDRVNCIEVACNSRLVSGSADGYIRVWNLDNGDCVEKLYVGKKVLGIKLISDNWLAIGSESNELKIYDLNNKVYLDTGKTRYRNVFGFELLEERGLLFSYSSDNSIRAWQI
jgi:WD40 repeat protein